MQSENEKVPTTYAKELNEALKSLIASDEEKERYIKELELKIKGLEETHIKDQAIIASQAANLAQKDQFIQEIVSQLHDKFDKLMAKRDLNATQVNDDSEQDDDLNKTVVTHNRSGSFGSGMFGKSQ